MSFKGFNEKTNDYFIGIRFNNNKQWFQEHKEMYNENVHAITVDFANELCEKMREFDKNFTEKPRVSRANRDVRFSKNKEPYKTCKWFFFRNEMKKGSVPHEEPGFFFEMSADWWRYGLFFGDNPKVMEKLRAKINADQAKCKRLIQSVEKKGIFTLEGEEYKRIFNKDLEPYLNKWAQKKWITYVRYEDYNNMDFYSEKLVDTVFNGFKSIYPIYEYFKIK